jgi:hypothetical protein
LPDCAPPERSATPVQVVEKLLDTVVNGGLDERAGLYALDAVIEMPFAPAGMPDVVRGREELCSRINAAADLWEYKEAR